MQNRRENYFLLYVVKLVCLINVHNIEQGVLVSHEIYVPTVVSFIPTDLVLLLLLLLSSTTSSLVCENLSTIKEIQPTLNLWDITSNFTQSPCL
jgi:hypothetical protein